MVRFRVRIPGRLTEKIKQKIKVQSRRRGARDHTSPARARLGLGSLALMSPTQVWVHWPGDVQSIALPPPPCK